MRPLVFVHGFRYDPTRRYMGGPAPDNPEFHLYPTFRKMLDRSENITPFMWFSNPTVWDAWRHRKLTRYRLAWSDAVAASRLLRNALIGLGDGADIVCHSLGSRVTMLALARCPIPAHRVLVLNGAEYSSTAAKVAEISPKTRFYNIVVPADDVLHKLARFAPGWGSDFLGNNGPPAAHNWTNLFLGSGLTAAWAEEKGYLGLTGDNPHSVGDHLFTYENPNNWPLYRAIFSGEWDGWWAKQPGQSPEVAAAREVA